MWSSLLSACLRVVFLVSTYLIWILGSKWILSNNQSRETLRVLDTCLIVGLRPLMILLITASSPSKIYSIALHREIFAFDDTQSTLFRSKCWVGTLVLLWVCLFDVVFRDEPPRTWSLVFFELVRRRMKHFKNQIQKIKSGNSIHA